MPVQPRRAVVLSMEAYRRLQEQSENVETTCASIPEEYVPEEPETEHDASPAPSLPIPPPPSSDEVIEQSPLDSIPLRYRPDAKRLLELIKCEPSFSVTTEGLVCINEQVQDLTVVGFLRCVCVPFTTTKLPLACKQIIDQLGIKPRNHLVLQTELQPWQDYFSV